LKQILPRNSYFVLNAIKDKPALITQALSFFMKRFLGRSVIRGVDIAITYDCNLKCHHCNIAAVEDKTRKIIEIDDIVKAIGQLRKIGGFYVTFTGGEVLLDLDYLERIVRKIGSHDLLLQVQTNGILLSDAVCSRLKSMGIDNLHVSLDTCHEYSEWEEVLRLKKSQLEMARKSGLFVIFIALASHETVNNNFLNKLIDFSEGNRVPVGLNFAVPQGRWSDNESILLTPEDSLYIRKISQENKYIFTDLDSNCMRYGCPAFSERFYINGYGDVQPCTFFQISFGNIKDEPLRDIWLRGLRNHLFKGFPDYCPPAENQKYIDLWKKKSCKTVRIPIFYNEFFT